MSLSDKLLNGISRATGISVDELIAKPKLPKLPKLPKVKILWIGDCGVSTGFAKCTHEVCPRLIDYGFDVVVMGMSYYGDPHQFPFRLYPCYQPLDFGKDYGGVGRLPRIISIERPDVIIILQDPWNIKPYVQAMKSACEDLDIPEIPMIGWLAVDGKNIKGWELNGLSHVVVWTEFARKELISGGCKVPITISTLGVDRNVFYPLSHDDRMTKRREYLKESDDPEKTFIIGVVGRNQYRKRLDLTIRIFARWIKEYRRDNVKLFLHIAPTGDGGVDPVQTARFYELLHGEIILSIPPIGHGSTEAEVNRLINSFDVLFSTTQGEGFGLPMLEAMSAGVNVAVPNWSGLGDDGWTNGAATLIDCSSTALTAPMNSMMYTIGGVVDEEMAVEALERLYSDDVYRLEMIRCGFDRVNELTWDRSAQGIHEAVIIARENHLIKLEKARKVDICITVLNRYDLLRKCLESLTKADNVGNVLLIDNGVDPKQIEKAISGITLNVKVLNDNRLGLAESWNAFIDATNIERIITNDDIEFSADSIFKLLDNKSDVVFPQGVGFSCFLLRDSCVSKIGRFDEALSPGFAYFEDCDYMNRIEAYNAVNVNSESPIIAADISDHGITHLKNGTQHAIARNEVSDFRRKYYTAQERFISKWDSLPVGLRRMRAEECDLESSVHVQ